MKVPLEYIHFDVKVPKTAKKVFWSSVLLRNGHSLLFEFLSSALKGELFTAEI
jgi:hypothetical protein